MFPLPSIIDLPPPSIRCSHQKMYGLTGLTFSESKHFFHNSTVEYIFMSYFVASSNSAIIPEAIAAAADVLPKLLTQPVTSQVFCYKLKWIVYIS